MSDIHISKVNWYLSWPVIILAFIFWPLGLTLLVLRFVKYRKDAIIMGKTIRFIGYVLTAFFLVLIILMAAHKEWAAVVSLVSFFAMSVLLIGVGYYFVKLSVLNKKYIEIIVNQRVRSLAQISTQIELPVDKVRKDVERMIKLGLLSKAYIDEQTQSIMVPAVTKQIIIEKQIVQQTETEIATAQQSTVKKPSLISCKACGANNMLVPGQNEECEFCGSFLTLEG